MADLKKLRFSKLPILEIFSWKFYGLVLGLVVLIDAKGIDVDQPIRSWGKWRKLKNRQKCIFFVFRLFLSLRWTASQPYTYAIRNFIFCFIPMEISQSFLANKTDKKIFIDFSVLKNKYHICRAYLATVLKGLTFISIYR